MGQGRVGVSTKSLKTSGTGLLDSNSSKRWNKTCIETTFLQSCAPVFEKYVFRLFCGGAAHCAPQKFICPVCDVSSSSCFAEIGLSLSFMMTSPILISTIGFHYEFILIYTSYFFFKQILHVCMLSCFSCVRLSATPWTVTRQAPLSVGFSRQEHWTVLPLLLQGIYLTQGLEPFPALQADSLLTEPPGKPKTNLTGGRCTFLVSYI